MGYWHGYLSRVWCKLFAYGPADATATTSFLASVKSRIVYLSGASLRVSNEGRINVLLWYCLVSTYVGLPLGVVGSPGGKWLRVVRG